VGRTTLAASGGWMADELGWTLFFVATTIAALPGLALDDCEPIWGDHISRIVKWKTGHDVSAHAGKSVRVRFEMSDADLYSMQFQSSKP